MCLSFWQKVGPRCPESLIGTTGLNEDLFVLFLVFNLNKITPEVNVSVILENVNAITCYL